jgi:hypothetical protein
VSARTYGGEVWTNEHGTAVVLLPPHFRGRELEYTYELEPAAATELIAVLEDARLTITSVVPHLKVTWRLTPRSRVEVRDAKDSRRDLTPNRKEPR